MLRRRWLRLREPFAAGFACAGAGRGVEGTVWMGLAGALDLTGATPLGPGDPSAFGPGLGALPCETEVCGSRVGPGLGTPGVGLRICTCVVVPGVTTGCGVTRAISGANVACGAFGCSTFGTGRAVGAAVGACVGGAVG